MDALLRLREQSPRTVVGLMSGTSLDGIDAVLARLDGSGPDLTMETEAFIHVPYPPALQNLIRQNTTAASSSIPSMRRSTRCFPADAMGLFGSKKCTSSQDSRASSHCSRPSWAYARSTWAPK